MLNRSSLTPAGPLSPGARYALVLVAGLLLLVAPAFQAGAAARGTSWCRVDPGLLIGDREAHVNLYADQAMLDAATGPIDLVVTVPMGKEHKTKLLYMDSGFGHGYNLVIKTSTNLKDSSSGTDILVEAYAPAGGLYMEVKVEIVPVSAGKAPTYAKGQSDRWITLRGKV